MAPFKFQGLTIVDKYMHPEKYKKRRGWTKKKEPSPPPQNRTAEIRRLKALPYDEYLKSDWWKSVRSRALQYAEHRCQICCSQGLLDVHHRTYARLGNEKPSDTTVLCRTCHGLFHESGQLNP